MLTLKRCREILGKDCPLTDEELEMLRDQFSVLAEVVLDAYEPAHARSTLEIVSSAEEGS